MFSPTWDYTLNLDELHSLKQRVERARTYNRESDQALIGRFRNLFSDRYSRSYFEMIANRRISEAVDDIMERKSLLMSIGMNPYSRTEDLVLIRATMLTAIADFTGHEF